MDDEYSVEDEANGGKVFCTACDWYIKGDVRDHAAVCSHPHARYFVRTPIAVRCVRRTPEERNASNECRDFLSRRLGWGTLRRHPAGVYFLALAVPLLVILLGTGKFW